MPNDVLIAKNYLDKKEQDKNYFSDFDREVKKYLKSAKGKKLRKK